MALCCSLPKRNKTNRVQHFLEPPPAICQRCSHAFLMLVEYARDKNCSKNSPKTGRYINIFGIFGHIWHIWARIWAPQLWSSGVSLKRSCKMQFRRVGLRSIGPSSQKLWSNLIFGPIAPLLLQCKTTKWCQEPIYGSIMLKIFVCHFLTKLQPFFTYEGGKSKKSFFGPT